MKRIVFVLTVALFAALVVFATVAQCDDTNGQPLCKRGEVELFKVPGGSEKTKLKIGPEQSPYFTTVAHIEDAPIDFVIPYLAGICYLDEGEEIPSDPTKCRFSIASQKKNYAVLKKPGKGFVLKLVDNKYLAIKATEFVRKWKTFEETPPEYRYMYRHEEYLFMGVEKRTRSVPILDKPAPPKLKSVKLTYAWWPKAIPQAPVMVLADDDAKHRYKVPMGEEIPLIPNFGMYLVFGEDSKGSFVAVRKYGPGQGSTFAYTAPLDIDKIRSPWELKYEHSYDTTSKTTTVAETRVPLVLGEGRQHKVDDNFFAVQPVSQEGKEVVFDMRAFLRRDFRAMVATANRAELNRKAGVSEATVNPERSFYLHGFSFAWEVLDGSKARLTYEARFSSVKRLDCAVVAQSYIAKIANPAELDFLPSSDSGTAAGTSAVSFGDVIVLRVNERFFIAMSPTELKSGGKVNGEQKQNVCYESKLWPVKPARETVAKVDTASAR